MPSPCRASASSARSSITRRFSAIASSKRPASLSALPRLPITPGSSGDQLERPAVRRDGGVELPAGAHDHADIGERARQPLAPGDRLVVELQRLVQPALAVGRDRRIERAAADAAAGRSAGWCGRQAATSRAGATSRAAEATGRRSAGQPPRRALPAGPGCWRSASLAEDVVLAAAEIGRAEQPRQVPPQPVALAPAARRSARPTAPGWSFSTWIAGRQRAMVARAPSSTARSMPWTSIFRRSQRARPSPSTVRIGTAVAGPRGGQPEAAVIARPRVVRGAAGPSRPAPHRAPARCSVTLARPLRARLARSMAWSAGCGSKACTRPAARPAWPAAR